VVVIAPLCEVVCELQTWGVGRCVFEIDDYKLFMGVLWEEERRRSLARGRLFGDEAKDVAILCL